MTTFGRRLLNVAVAVDEVGNSILGGLPREAISGTIGRAYLAGASWAPFAAWLVDGIFGRGHCVTNALNENLARLGNGKRG